jgi:hypothetical protein
MRFLLLILVSISGNLLSQDSTTCVVTRYFGTDTSSKEIYRKITFDSRGRIISEASFYSATEVDEGFYKTGHVTRYVFSDSLLTEKVETRYGENPLKSVYTYNEKGQCTHESGFSWEPNHTAAPVKPGGGQGAATVSGKWNQVSDAVITYDQKGNKIMWDASRLHNSSENMYKWTYDEKGRVTSYETYKRGARLIKKTDYQYVADGYRYWNIEYSDDGTPRHELEKGQGYRTLFIHAVTLNKASKMVEDKVSDESGKMRHSMKYWYDEKGRIEKEVKYYHDGKLNDVYIYKYSN